MVHTPLFTLLGLALGSDKPLTDEEFILRERSKEDAQLTPLFFHAEDQDERHPAS